MPLSRNQVIQLYIAGAVTIPPFPEMGLITLIEAKENHENVWTGGALKPSGRAFVRIDYRASPAQSTNYELPLADVAAFLWETNMEKLNPIDDWWLSPEIDARLSDSKVLGKLVEGRMGIVFVKESSGVIVHRGMTAGEISAIPGGCA